MKRLFCLAIVWWKHLSSWKLGPTYKVKKVLSCQGTLVRTRLQYQDDVFSWINTHTHIRGFGAFQNLDHGGLDIARVSYPCGLQDMWRSDTTTFMSETVCLFGMRIQQAETRTPIWSYHTMLRICCTCQGQADCPQHQPLEGTCQDMLLRLKEPLS